MSEVMTKKIPKYSRKALEKIWNVLQEIEETRQLSSPEDYIKLTFRPPNFYGSKLEFDEVARQRTAIVNRLVYLNALTDLDHKTGMNGFLFFKVGPQYKVVFRMYEGQYKNAARDYKKTNLPETEISDPVYEIRYSEKSREITINNFLLKKPDFDSENERFFTYVYANPNKRIDTKDLKAEGVVLKKTIHKVIENLGFTTQLKAVFFDVSKSSVRFKNPVSKSDLNEIAIKYLDFK